jgi:hypothetical protein
MDLKCPKCASEDTQKLSLAMQRGGNALEKSATLHSKFGANVAVPLATVLFAVIFGIPLLASSPVMGLVAIAVIIYAGYVVRGKLTKVSRSPFDDLPLAMQESGFQCNRCGHQFVPQ